MKKSLFGLNENVASALAYVGMFVTGVIVFIMERENKNVRFHGLQSLVLFGALCLISGVGGWMLGWIPLIGGLIAWALRTVTFVAWLFMTLVTYTGKTFKVPVIGEYCWAYVNK